MLIRSWQYGKYLLAYLIPLSALVALFYGGACSYATVIIAFVFIPVAELILPADGGNPDPEQETRRAADRFFDLLLYLNVPLLSQGSLGPEEWIGMTLSAGIAAGAAGINVAHELGHRPDPFNQWVARLLLLPEFYQHFTIEHNFGHHKNIATPLDPATARKGETVYAFWLRSISGSYRGAWRIEREHLKRTGKAFWSADNRMLLFTIMPVLYLAGIIALFGFFAASSLILVGLIGVLLLETINYVEHYGLLREKLPNGRFEPVGLRHSWNSNHELGRIFLYELTRHADHHDKANRKYPVLRHFDESPQLPLGYPASILISLVPPLWFTVMDKRIPGNTRPVLN